MGPLRICLVVLSFFFICSPLAAAAPNPKGGLEKRYTSPTVIAPSNITRTPLNVFLQILETQANPDPNLIKEYVALDATYVSLTIDNPNLHKIMPWAGTRYQVGPQAFLDTFTRVGLWWTRGPFSIDAIFADGGNCTAWGQFEITSNTMQKTITSPWSARAVVNDQGMITYFQYMEDTFGTASTFWADGSKQYRAHPDGGSVWF
ncbi:uncharacterized protein N7479_008938 [Penicillium vulpinum]|uniref:SnoaL-like domain-containing protein n=1 Tax=Penicillium vulpinum TaxID=29845 RepID=A0A1V6RFN1_9EURO|nr:uncharacterized protein N7479_008938 [Penicillium vulpinum]KAJ5950525.1 hypothetical protein N7479_008938 [Penicillium vulpinum]OQE00350.1 hypothetical protein PENVUL_c053G07297 [Penicillium vulpinum]